MAKVSKTMTGFAIELAGDEADVIGEAWAREIERNDPYHIVMLTIGRALRALRPRDVEVTVTVPAGVVAVLMSDPDARDVSQLGAGLAVIDLVGGEVRKAMRG